MALTTTNAQIAIQDGAGATVNYNSGALTLFTPGSVWAVSLQSTAGVQQWNLKFECPAYPSLHQQIFYWRQGQNNLILVPMPVYPASNSINPFQGIYFVSEVSDGVQSIAQALYYAQSLGGWVVPTARAVRCIANLGTNGLGGSGYANVSGVLTATGNGAWTNSNSDSVAIAVGDRVLAVGAGVNNYDNGVYQVTSLGSASTPWVLTRAPDMPQGIVIQAGSTYEVSEGTRYANSTWKDTLAGQKTIGTTNMAAAYFPKSIVGAVTLSGGAASVTALFVSTPLGSTAPGPGVSVAITDFTSAAATKGVLTAGNGNGSLALTGTSTDVLQYTITNW